MQRVEVEGQKGEQRRGEAKAKGPPAFCAELISAGSSAPMSWRSAR
jgi:hypothetical protein